MLRFWGKIYGVKADYFIVEGELNRQEEQPTDRTQELRGEGANRFVYWVSTNPLNDWVQLPDTLPAHINAARQIKHTFSGDLNSSIDSNPVFPGKERHYLRAQIARIAMSSDLIPKGLLEVDEETNQEKFAEEFALPGTIEELKSNEAWGHRHPIILEAGRCSHQAPAHMTEEERDEYLAAQAEKDAPVDRYRGINEDAPWKGLETAWIINVVGDQQPYNGLPPNEN